VRRHHANALLSHDAFDEAYNPANLGSPIARGAAFPALPADHVFLLLQGVQAIRHRKSKAAVPSDSVTEYAMDELDYKPRNSKEKWLLRIAYWGTIALVAFLWWEYVKAR